MAITYPRDMPGCMFVNQSFDLQRVDYASPETNGRIGGVTAGVPLWAASWDVNLIDLASGDALQAWINSLRGQQMQFYGRDIGRALPAAYRGGFGGLTRADGSAFDGTASGWSTDGTRSILSMIGLPAEFQMRVGDYAGFAWGAANQCTLVRALESFGASDTGVLTVAVEPSIPTVVPANATLTLQNARCLMRLTPDTKLDTRKLLKLTTGVVAALQDLRA